MCFPHIHCAPTPPPQKETNKKSAWVRCCNFKSLRGTFNWSWNSLNLVLMPHILHQQMRPSATSSEITILSFTKSLPGLLSQWKCFKTFYDTKTGGDDLLFMSIIDPLFSFNSLWLEAGGDFSFYHSVMLIGFQCSESLDPQVVIWLGPC